MFISRIITESINEKLNNIPAVAILGPRQCGKSTLAKHIITQYPNSLYLDLENPADLEKLNNPLLFLKANSSSLICLDEIQRAPELFSILRSIIDGNNRNGQFLILGSASPDLIKQSSESLAGRIIYQELTPFLYSEIKNSHSLLEYWFKGGFPRSILSKHNKNSLDWLQSFIKTFLERDIPQLGYGIPSNTMRRLWQMLAHCHGQTLNSSKLSESLGVSNVTVRKYIDLLASTYMLRLLPPYEINLKKRLIKSPKVYIRDSGILNKLLNLDDFNSLLAHPVFGTSWESIVIENILAHFYDFNAAFYKTQDGAEIDLIIFKENIKFTIECKSSMSPKAAKGFWISIEDIKPDKAYIAAPVATPYPLADNVFVGNFESIIKDISKELSLKKIKLSTVSKNYIDKLGKL